MNNRIISQKVTGPERTFVSEDVKHILDQIDNILYIQRKMIDTILNEQVKCIDTSILSAKELNRLMKNDL